MKTIIIILTVGSIVTILRAIILSYIRMTKGGSIITLFKQMHWINYVPIVNFLLYVLVIIYKGLTKPIK